MPILSSFRNWMTNEWAEYRLHNTIVKNRKRIGMRKIVLYRNDDIQYSTNGKQIDGIRDRLKNKEWKDWRQKSPPTNQCVLYRTETAKQMCMSRINALRWWCRTSLSSSSIHLITHRIPMKSQINSLSLSLSLSPNTEFDSATNEWGFDDHNVTTLFFFFFANRRLLSVGLS